MSSFCSPLPPAAVRSPAAWLLAAGCWLLPLQLPFQLSTLPLDGRLHQTSLCVPLPPPRAVKPRLLTPGLADGTILPGVTRQSVLELAADGGAAHCLLLPSRCQPVRLCYAAARCLLRLSLRAAAARCLAATTAAPCCASHLNPTLVSQLSSSHVAKSLLFIVEWYKHHSAGNMPSHTGTHRLRPPRLWM